MGWEGEGAGAEAQGKRIRPVLVLLSAEAAGGSWRSALPAAAAVELLHNFSLVHDDIQDQSSLRRNRSTLWVKWGIAQAINAGDVLFTLSFLAMQRLLDSLAAEDVLLSSRLLQETCLRLTEGQYLDIAYEKKSDLPMEAYWPMIGGKTSALLSCCTELGAVAAGANERRRTAFREYGDNLGLAFQVLDDWLGIWGDVGQTGKSVESDLASGKKTLPVLYAIGRGGRFARRWLQGPILADEVPDLARLLEEEGAYSFTLETAQRLTDKAHLALQQAACDNEAAVALVELTHMLLRRKN
jgi:geranylgeranyl diphosphate synthase type I